MRAAGVSHNGQSLWRLAAALFALTVIGTPAAYAAGVPITAADAERAGAAPAAAVEGAPVAEAPPIGGASATAPAAAPSMAAGVAPAAIESASGTPPRSVITEPAVPPISDPGYDAVVAGPQGTQEIPQVLPDSALSVSVPSDDAPVASVAPGTIPDSTDDLKRYEEQNPDVMSSMGGSRLGSARDFVAEGEESSPIGIEMREAHRKLNNGGEADGLLIVDVTRDSAAARAGLKPYRRIAHNMLTGATIAAAMVFPPAILVLPLLDYTQIGESYDLIIGVDGSRVTNFIDFEDRMRDIRPGELVYFSVVRNGRRVQISVPIPATATTSSN